MNKHKLALIIGILAAFLLLWLSLGVGIIGEDGNPANIMYFGVLAVGLIGALLSRLKPAGMATTLFIMALTQAVITIVAIASKMGMPWSDPLQLEDACLLSAQPAVVFLGSWIRYPSCLICMSPSSTPCSSVILPSLKRIKVVAPQMAVLP